MNRSLDSVDLNVMMDGKENAAMDPIFTLISVFISRVTRCSYKLVYGKAHAFQSAIANHLLLNNLLSEKLGFTEAVLFQ